VKIAYALRFANLADFVSCRALWPDAGSEEDRSASSRPPTKDDSADGIPRVFVDAERGHNLYDDPIT
jgi:hypothetical protein